MPVSYSIKKITLPARPGQPIATFYEVVVVTPGGGFHSMDRETYTNETDAQAACRRLNKASAD